MFSCLFVGSGILEIIESKTSSIPKPSFALTDRISSLSHPINSIICSDTASTSELGISILFKIGIIVKSASTAKYKLLTV